MSSPVIKQQRIFSNLPEADIRNFYGELADGEGAISRDNFLKLLNAFYVGFVFDVQLSSVPKADLTNALENLKFLLEKHATHDKETQMSIHGLCEGGLTRNPLQLLQQQN